MRPRFTPAVTVAPTAVNVTAGGAGATLAATTANCSGCTLAWALDAECPVHSGKGTHGGASWTIAAGLVGSEVVDTTGKTEPFECTATVTATDEHGASGTDSATIRVRGGAWQWLCARVWTAVCAAVRSRASLQAEAARRSCSQPSRRQFGHSHQHELPMHMRPSTPINRTYRCTCQRRPRSTSPLCRAPP